MPGEIVGILLAAGQGSRFGSDKLLHSLPDGTPLAVAAARNLCLACNRVIAILRPGSDFLAGLLSAAGCETVICPDAESGMGYSLAAGVKASPSAAGWLVALADMPFIAPASHQAVAASLRAGASLAAGAYQGRRGHPVGFAGRWFEQLAALTGDQGGKSILEAHRQELTLCPVDDPGVLRDIDRPADLSDGLT
ncbi:nucleotidyltransferase family protein [Dechloromonas sp. A34]|uniref:nucleotidyltransferase family protein n=1 Tax=Dechloromonas sp. A34 TaxID=447588 RepID=UPI002249081F|nr:nucleotidyltransferase family protein [Dechloromonas sp. A34]